MPLLYGEVAGGYAIIASRGGTSRHPRWYYNLTANPEVTVKLVNDTFRANVREVTGGERAAVWKQMVAMYPPFDVYEKKAAPLEIPVMVLERVE